MINWLRRARKIHRFLVLTTTLLIVLMSGTGSILKFSSFIIHFLPLDLGLIRYLHNQLSFWFSLDLLFMATTGLTLYFSPLLLKLGTKKVEKT